MQADLLAEVIAYKAEMKLAPRGIANSNRLAVPVLNLVLYACHSSWATMLMPSKPLSGSVSWSTSFKACAEGLVTHGSRKADTVNNISRTRVLDMEMASCCCQELDCNRPWAHHCHKCCSNKGGMESTSRGMPTCVHNLGYDVGTTLT